MSEGTVDFRNRLLLWHRTLAQMTGTLSLSYGGKGVSRAAMQEWASRLRTVATDMESITGVENSRLDKAGRSRLLYAASTAPLAHEQSGKADQFFGKDKGGAHGPAGVKASIKDNRKSGNNSPAPALGKVGRVPILKKATRKIK